MPALQRVVAARRLVRRRGRALGVSPLSAKGRREQGTSTWSDDEAFWEAMEPARSNMGWMLGDVWEGRDLPCAHGPAGRSTWLSSA